MSQKRGGESGAAMVEFALVLPLLLLLVLGIIDFGRAFNMQIALTQAAREGVRVVALGGTPADARQRTFDAAFPYTAAGGLSVPAPTTCPASPTATTPPARITATQTFQFLGYLNLPSVIITGRGEMRCSG